MILTIKEVKEHNEGVKSQIKVIKEDINKLSNDGFNVEVKLDELDQYARRHCLKLTGEENTLVQFEFDFYFSIH